MNKIGKSVHRVTDYFGQTVGLFSSKIAAEDCVDSGNYGFECVGEITVVLREISRDHYMSRSGRTQIDKVDAVSRDGIVHVFDAIKFMNEEDLASAFRPEFEIHGHTFANNLCVLSA